MRFFIFIILYFSSVFIDASHVYERKIAKLARPYEQAVEFIMNMDQKLPIDDFTIFQFFAQSSLSTRKNQRIFRQRLKTIKFLANHQIASEDLDNEINFLIENLDKVQSFITEHADVHYAYYDILGYYHYVNELEYDIVAVLMETSTQLGLPSMHDRGLYKFVKKIDLDLRRLNFLFINNILPDQMVLKIKELQNKLFILKNNIIHSFDYKEQLTKTRWFKALGIIIVIIPFMVFFIQSCLLILSERMLQVCAVATYIIMTATMLSMTAIELNESLKYQIPVHSRSYFSFFRPWFWPFTWVKHE